MASRLIDGLGHSGHWLQRRVSNLARLSTHTLLSGGLLTLSRRIFLLPQLGLASEKLGLLALLPGLRPAFFGLVLLSLLGLGDARFHLVRNALDLLFAQGALNCRKELLPIVTSMLTEHLLQLGETLREYRVVLRHAVELCHFRTQLLVVADRVGDQVLGLRISSQDREEVLLLETSVEFQLGLELRKEPLPGLHCAVRGLGQLSKQLVGFGRTGLH